METLNKKLVSVLAAVVLAVGMFAFAGVSQADAKPYVGTYEYIEGHPELWGVNKGPQNGYILQCDITKVSGNRATLKIEQVIFYGDAGYYCVDSRKKTVTVKSNYASFKFKTYGGDTCKARLKVVSKNKIKLAVKTTSAGRERIPMSTGYKYKTLTRR